MAINQQRHMEDSFFQEYITGKAGSFHIQGKSDIPELNGWTIYSCDDDNDYAADPDHFQIVGSDTIKKCCPMLLKEVRTGNLILCRPVYLI